MRNRFDYLVLTASNDGQAEAYRSELEAREASVAVRSLVVADPGGRRVGSGVATLLALSAVATDLRKRHNGDLASLLRGVRVAVIHCGGDSRRLPAYAAHGKIFAPLPLDPAAPRPPALFDLIAADLAGLALPSAGRVVVATGDVFLDLAGQDLPLGRAGVVGVGWASNPERGSRHGVYIADASGNVTGFVHKPSPAQARASGAVRPDGTLLVDTGVVVIDPPTIAAWLRAAGVNEDGEVARGLLAEAAEGIAPTLDLYGDILPAMAARRRLAGLDWRGGAEFTCAQTRRCAFLHIGSSRELLDTVAGDGAEGKFLSSVRSRTPPLGPRTCVHNSVLEAPPRRMGARVMIESSHLREAPSLAGSNIVVGVPGAAAGALELALGWGIVCLPLARAGGDERWVAIVFGEADDFKSPLSAGGTFGGRTLREFLASAGLAPEALWAAASPDRQTLWNARLWTPTEPDELLASVQWILRGGRAPAGWAATERLSTGEVMERVDHSRLLQARDKVLRCV